MEVELLGVVLARGRGLICGLEEVRVGQEWWSGFGVGVGVRVGEGDGKRVYSGCVTRRGRMGVRFADDRWRGGVRLDWLV